MKVNKSQLAISKKVQKKWFMHMLKIKLNDKNLKLCIRNLAASMELTNARH